MTEILSIIVAALSVVVAAWLGLKNHALAEKNKDLQMRLLELEEVRERDRVRESSKAELVADIIPGGKGHRLEVWNRGRADARNITVLLDGIPILQHPGLAAATKHELNKDLTNLPAGTRFRYVLSPHLQARPPWELEITWTDDSCNPGLYRTTLTF